MQQALRPVAAGSKARADLRSPRRVEIVRAMGLASVALFAIAIGVAVYALARPQAAMFLPSGWHRPLAQGMPWWFIAGLPTFVHGLAMPLLIAAVAGARRHRTLFAISAAWVAVEVVFEAAQHAVLRDALLALDRAQVPVTGWLAPLAGYLRAGTFDVIDIAAALLAGGVAFAILVRSRIAFTDSRETDHGHA